MFLVNVYCLIRRKKMKKLFSLVLVLALCGIASAATVDFYITDSLGSDDITIESGSDINLYVWYDGESLSTFDLDATCDITKDFEFISGVITATNRDTSLDGAILGSQTEIEVLGVALDSATPGVGQTLGKTVATPLAKILYRCASTETVVIDIAFWAAATTGWIPLDPEVDTITMHGMTITQPEPATIALLCLGGLLLRKKR